MLLAATVVILLLALYALLREADVRLVLFLAGLALALLVLKPLIVFDTFLSEMGNGKTIGPIGSAMGYASVLRATGCDQAMVRLLLAPARGIRWLLIPVGCAVGPILLPLMLAAGYPPVIAAATLALGSSGGGSLLNPGDADLVAIHESSQAPMHTVLQAMFSPLVAGFATAVAVLAAWSWRPRVSVANGTTDEKKPHELLQALLPPLPILLIFLMLPGVLFPALPPPFEKGLPVPYAMIAGTMIVLLVHRREFSLQVKSFFEGMGYAYVHVISLIVTSSCFIAGLSATGMTEKFVQVVSGTGVGGKVAAGFLPGLLAVISGSGLGPSVAFAKAVLPPLGGNLPLALDLGSLAAIAASFGRTMSPVAAVVIFSATLTGVSTWQLIRRVAPVLLIGYVAVLAVVVARG